MHMQDVSNEIFAAKYAKEGETRSQVFSRVVQGLARTPEEAAHFQYALESGGILAGRVMSAAGSQLETTLINCFVQPVGDSVTDMVDSKASIYQAVAEAAETMRRGGGVGYDFSKIRPAGARVRRTQSRASGPLSYMRVFDRSCETVESAGARRGAQMGVLRVDHPDIFDFVDAKKNGDFTNFNLSVGVTDAFMEALEWGERFELVHDAEPFPGDFPEAYQRDDGLWVYRTIDPQELWDRIMENTYNGAEPGVLFIDRMNEENNLHYVERIEATNPLQRGPPW
ncbi:Ribonucleotide reductase, barrel domain [Thiohalospira halophila DSM 15071]|uniref:Ribonucleotide reductase, barrel domain n=1 Tax=Thiohalospira halophila DSM 15071 TaxID=1123397 RepID=A0A1I1N5M7_9GAMM|nr:hypothetical protein [Thiohalospira halophila]SFC92492.1 Ribonucleotide reductase, barrel domain [Thiohalospira halophila DSM 15071]